MEDASSPAAEIRAWMLAVLADTGMSPGAWAKAAGVAGTTVTRAIKPSYEFTTSSRTLAKLAAAAGKAPPELRRTAEVQIVPRFLPVRYRVQAGNWIEADGAIQEFRAAFAVAPDPRYADWAQWLEEVVGDSINQRIPEGGFAHVVDAIDMGYAPRQGDLVVVERRRNGGHLTERTIKQVEVSRRGEVALWPRSTNPKWSEPINLSDGARDGEEIEVAIVGLVIGSYSSFV